jgi:predicted nucleic acid-binding protein
LKKISIYLDTSVIGGCFDPEFEEHSSKLINEIISDIKKGFISEVTIEELSDAPNNIKKHFESYEDLLTILEISDEAKNLADEYLKERIISEKSYADALHIAIATVNNIDIVASWNFKHIVNYEKITQFNYTNMKNRYKSIAIHSPREVIKNEV